MAETAAPPSLTFPRGTFAVLSPRAYLLANLRPTSVSSNSAAVLRPNGRAPAETRPPHLNTNSLTHAHGSAVVRVGDTAVVCGVRGEMLQLKDAPGYQVQAGRDPISDLSLLVPNIELATGCNPAHLPGLPPSTLAQSLSARILSLMQTSKLIPSTALEIWYNPPKLDMEDVEEQDAEEPEAEIKAFWTLYIDLVFISLDGNPFDAAWAAVVCALANTRLPQARWSADEAQILCSPLKSDLQSLHINGLPIALTFGVFSTKSPGLPLDESQSGQSSLWELADPDTFEESQCKETLTIVVDCSAGREAEMRLLRIEKNGGTGAGLTAIKRLLPLVERRWWEWRALLNEEMNKL